MRRAARAAADRRGTVTYRNRYLTAKRDAILASDRPFRRQVVKVLAQILLGRRRAHYHAWLPSLRIEKGTDDEPGEVRYRGRRIFELSALDALTARIGSHVLIVGSGPSVAGADLRRLPPRRALLLNGAIGLAGGGLVEPLAVAIEDERFVWRHFAMISHHVRADVPMLLSVGAIRALCDIDAGFLPGRPVILIDDIRKPYGRPRRADSELAGMDPVTLRGAAGFSAAPSLGVFQGGSVVVSALQFALAGAAAEIGFIGVDIANADAPRFYERAGAAAYSGVAAAGRRILDHIALARDVAAARGVRLVNHSPVSALWSIGLDYVPFDQSAL